MRGVLQYQLPPVLPPVLLGLQSGVPRRRLIVKGGSQREDTCPGAHLQEVGHHGATVCRHQPDGHREEKEVSRGSPILSAQAPTK